MVDRLAPAPSGANRTRRTWLTDQIVLPQRADVAVTAVGPCTRFIHRSEPNLLGAAFGVALPTVPCRAAAAGDRAALWLGPDEWLLLAPDASSGTAGAAGNTVAGSLRETLRQGLAGQAASLVDISHRNAGLIVSGSAAARLLSSACPLDLDLPSFPVGMVARTIFGKAEIVLWRTAPETFHIEVQRSFAPYVAGLLTESMPGID